jgi:hypothetical protein
MNWRDDEEYAALSGGHVEELVVHWRTTGSLDYPFATGGQQGGRAQTSPGLDSAHRRRTDIRGARLIGELGVDRDSVRRAFRDDPDRCQ